MAHLVDYIALIYIFLKMWEIITSVRRRNIETKELTKVLTKGEQNIETWVPQN